MIKSYNGYKPERTSTREPLPAGGYVAKILDANVLTYDWGEVLKVDFDICEGDYKDFFGKDYRNNTADNKKWRGAYRINIPNESNQYFDSQRKSFNNFVACIEESNSGFHWAWEEKSLKGKTLGVLFRNKEYEMDTDKGEHITGWTTECSSVTTADAIREGKFRTPKDKPLKAKTESTSAFTPSAFAPAADDSDLPF